MQDFEKLGVFYLGRPYDLVKKKQKAGWVLYDSTDLVTHAVCVGMTGSGKTGLCLALLEEAAIDGIPAIIIDPKGDLGNLLLTFPDLQATDFLPWINEDDARKKGLSPEEYAAQQAETWKKGLAAWGQDGARIQRLKDAADFTIYTPGSNAGLPVSILKSFSAPDQEILDDAELFQERISTTATSLLGLLGLEGDPIKSREHILLSTLFARAWNRGEDLDLAGLIQHIHTPPVSKVGVLDVDSFFPSKERFAFAMKLNNLLAAPGFSAWLEGEALDIGRILHTPRGKPRMAIFSIAHLNDAERMFFVTLLLSQMVGWMRTQSGTTSLRALVYMDEIFGYFPPVSNPPSKLPLLTLLKQGRAFGLGVVLATQNPVDLDYKGLANTGTWFIGRLQTERDKARVLEGLEGASAGAGRTFDRRRLEQILAGLGARIFLMNNVHEDEPVVFETRWCLSYLRGPLTRAQIKTLMASRKDSVTLTKIPASETETTPSAGEQPPRDRRPRSSGQAGRPTLPPDIPQHFIPIRGTRPTAAALLYRPMLLGAGQIRFTDTKAGIDATQDVTALTPITEGALAVNWDESRQIDLSVADLGLEPEPSAEFDTLPTAGTKPKNYDTWRKDFANWLYRSRTLEVLKSPRMNQLSRPGESERDFRVRLQHAGREQRDREMERLRKTYAPKIAALQERLRRAEHVKEREAEQAKAAYVQTAISVGATLLGAVLGRKTISANTIGRATTAARGVGRSIKESQDAARAGETIDALRRQLQDREDEFKREAEALAGKMDPLAEPLDTVTIKPSKSNIAVKLVALAWVPHWKDPSGTLTQAWS